MRKKLYRNLATLVLAFALAIGTLIGNYNGCYGS